MPPGLRRFAPLALLAVALLLQWALWRGAWATALPPGYVATTGPLAYDYSVLTYQMQTARDFFATSGRLYGQDVFLNGGLPLSFIWNSNVVLQTLAVALPGVDLGTLLYNAFWLAVMAFPLAWWGALWLALPPCGGDTQNHRLAQFSALLLLGLALFRAGLPTLFLWAAMTPAAMLVAVAVVCVALFVRAHGQGGWQNWWHVCFALALGMWVHKTLVVVMGFVWLGALLSGPRRGRLMAWGLVAAALAAVVNWFWIKGLVAAWEFKTLLPLAPFWVEPPVRFLKDHFTGTQTYLTGEMPGLWGTTLMSLTALVLGGWGAVAAWRGGQSVVRGLAWAWLGLGVFVVLGGLQGFDSATKIGATLNHYRFLIHWQLLGLFLWACARWQSPPSAPDMAKGEAGLHSFSPLTQVGEGGANSSFDSLKGFLPALAMGVLAVMGLALPTYYRFFEQKPVVSGVPRQAVALVAKLKTLLGHGGGLLLEDSGGWDRTGPGEKYYGAYLTGQIPWLTGRHQLGGPYPYVFLTTQTLSPLDGRWMGRDARAVSGEEARRVLRRYDVGVAAVWSGPMRGLLARAGCAPVGQQDVFALFRCPLAPRPPVAVLRLNQQVVTAALRPPRRGGALPLPVRAGPFLAPSAAIGGNRPALTRHTPTDEPTPLWGVIFSGHQPSPGWAVWSFGEQAKGR